MNTLLVSESVLYVFHCLMFFWSLYLLRILSWLWVLLSILEQMITGGPAVCRESADPAAQTRCLKIFLLLPRMLCVCFCVSVRLSVYSCQKVVDEFCEVFREMGHVTSNIWLVSDAHPDQEFF